MTKPTTPDAAAPYHYGLPELDRQLVTRLIAPNYLGSVDAPWLQHLIEERTRFTGQPRRLWKARTLEPLRVSAPPSKRRIALAALDRLTRDVTDKPALALARKIRETLFREAAQRGDRAQALASASAKLGLSETEIEARMFSDLPDERSLAPLPDGLTTTQLANLGNDAIVGRLMHRALRVRIEARGQARALVRHAKLLGLLCQSRPGTTADTFELEVSGPYALFRHTRSYGVALQSLVARLTRCDSYRLEAECVLSDGREVGRLVLRAGDPLQPARALPDHDSQTEARFARDFQRLALAWDLHREPQPVAIGAELCFPDFALQHRGTGERYWLEIVGFWTPAYLTKKLAQLRQARLQNLILCVDESRRCSDGDFEGLGQIMWFRRKIDALAVLAIIEPERAAELKRAGQPVARRRTKRSALPAQQ